jgi:hypothetical protein
MTPAVIVWHWSYFLIVFGLGTIVMHMITDDDATTHVACMFWAAVVAAGVAML